MSDLALAFRQARYENRAFWRNPAAAVFTFVFPLMFLVIFDLLISAPYKGFGRGVPAATFFTPAIVAFSVITACYTNIAMGLVFARESGVLKRLRGTPLPPWAFLFGRIFQSVGVGVLLVLIVTAFGAVFYHVKIPAHTLPAALVSIATGAATFCALGIAATALVPNEDAAPAIINILIFPLLFISDIFIPLDRAPKWLAHVANMFPIRHFSHAMLAAFDPFQRGSGFAPRDLLVMGIWGLAGVALARRFFSWEPRRG